MTARPRLREPLLALLFVAAPAVLDAQAIGGIVHDQASGAPLVGLRTAVRALGALGGVPGGDSALVTTTGPDGTFVVPLPAAGRYQVRFTLDSLTEFESDSLTVGPDEFAQREFRLTRPARAYAAGQVERPVVPLASNVGPRYPADLRGRHVAGRVVAQFVIDTAGRVRPGSFRATAWDELAFVAAVREAVYAMRFRPATIDGRAVPQLVTQTFDFRPD
jgi:TonB family protein